MFSKKMLFLFIFALTVHSAWAGSNLSCHPIWSLNRVEYDRCNNLPILSPGNDTRVNLKLLLIDNGFASIQSKPVAGKTVENSPARVPFSLESFNKNYFVSKNRDESTEDENRSSNPGGGNRCVSNDAGKTDFIDALEQSRDLSSSERKLLTEERQKLTPTCVDATAHQTSDKAAIPNRKSRKSKAYKEFMQYITAAAAFYEGRYEEAGSIFAGLADSKQPWLKETSQYMLGRTELNLSQQNAHDADASTPGKSDQKALQSAEEKFSHYLDDYPDGRYSASARGLLRRIYWLSNQQQKLADEYEWQLKHPDSPQHNLSVDALVQEVDQKLFTTANPDLIKSPLLLATMDLSLMRAAGSADAKKISYSDLQKQQPVFSDHKELFAYLLAAHQFYVQNDAENALKSLPDDIPSKMTYLDVSRLALRGLALEAASKQLSARKLWLDLMHASKQPLQAETLQLALALNYEHSKELESVFAPNSPITRADIRSILLRNVASPELLRQVIKAKRNSGQERRVAIYTLLYKDLLHGQYQDFLRDYRLLPKDAARNKKPGDAKNVAKSRLALLTLTGKKIEDGYNCPSALDIAKTLAKDAEDSYSLICLGDLVFANDLESGNESGGKAAKQTSDSGKAVLGSGQSHFPGEAFSRGAAYATIIDDENAAPDLKAYALFRAIKCYAPSGTNHCGGEDAEQSARKSWYQTLKTRYPDSVWAKSLKYYW